MKKHHLIAATLAAITIVLLLVDTAIAAVTGEHTFITDDGQGSTLTVLLSGLALGTVFASMGLVVLRESPRFATARRPARLVRPVLTYGLFFLAAGFVTVQPLQTILGDESSPAVQVSGLVALAALTAVVASSLVLGLSLVGRNPLGVGGRVLVGLLPVMLLTALLGLVAPTLASPVYCTMVVLAGVSLLGVRAEPGAQSATRPATESPSAAV